MKSHNRALHSIGR